MANLLNTIPSYKPQQKIQKPVTNSVVTNKQQNISSETNTFQKFSYIPAKPIAPALTQPKGAKPIKAKGYLVKENLLQSAGSTIKSYADYVKYCYNAAFKGEGTDYSVGKINDLAIRAGSLGIAAVLATTKFFPFAKGMEFVGLGTWFASMALWPKIIGLPIKFKTGVDINQKYVDSYGRRKDFYEDPQYLLWDLYRHIDKKGQYNPNAPEFEKLNLIGDKLGIPRSIKNRNEAIQDKSKQVAIQGKTLTMLTAGVMTPVLSSVIADALQQPLEKFISDTRIKNSEKKTKNLIATLESLIQNRTTDINVVSKTLKIKPDTKAGAVFNSLLEKMNDRLSEKGLIELKEFIRERYDGTGISSAFINQLDSVMNAKEPYVHITKDFETELQKITKEAIQEIYEQIDPQYKSAFPKHVLEFGGLKQHEISAALSEAGVRFGEEEIGLIKQQALKDSIVGKVKWNINETTAVNRRLNNEIQARINEKLESYFTKTRYNKVNTETLKKMFNFAELNRGIQTQLDNIRKATIMDMSESATAINWTKVPKKYFEALGFNKAQLQEIASVSESYASKLLAKHFEELVKDENKFNNVVKAMSEMAATAISKEERAVLDLIGTADKPGVVSKARQVVKQVAETNFGHEMASNSETYFVELTRKTYQKLMNTIDSFVRPIKGLDTFKDIDRIVEDILGKTVDDFKRNLQNKPVYYTFITPEPVGATQEQLAQFYANEFARAKKGLAAYIKDIVLQKNDINNWTTKMELAIPGYKKGINHSKEMLWKIANEVNGEISASTSNPVIQSQTTQEAKSLLQKFFELANRTTEKMKFHYMGIDNEIWQHANESNINRGILEKFFKQNDFGVYDDIVKYLKERVHELGQDDINNCIQILNDYKDKFKNASEQAYQRESSIQYLLNRLNFKIVSQAVTERQGKDITSFIKDASQNLFSRNKWIKLAYGLLIGTSALTLASIFFIGKKNYFNKDEYEHINKKAN